MDKQQKQIEEMANDVRSYYHGSEYDELEDDISFSVHLVNLGWIKLDENAVLLTMEDYKLLDKKIKALEEYVGALEENKRVSNALIERLKEIAKMARKETAEKIMNDISNDVLVITTIDYGSVEVVPLDRISEICENIIKGE